MANLDTSETKNRKRNLSETPESSKNNSQGNNSPKIGKNKKKKLVKDDAGQSIVHDNSNIDEPNSPNERKKSKSFSENFSSPTVVAESAQPPKDTDSVTEVADDACKDEKPHDAKKLSVLNKIKNRNTNKKPNSEPNQPKEATQKVFVPKMTLAEVLEKYPILNDQDLIKTFRDVTITNNQKGRIRQQFVGYFRSTAIERIPDAINLKLEDAIRKKNLTDSDYRRIRILHNMLNASVMKLVKPETSTEEPKNKEAKRGKKTLETSDSTNSPQATDENPCIDSVDKEKGNDSETKEKAKVKGPKRYVVFVGNLSYDVDKDAIMRHFSTVVSKIKDVRIPVTAESKKGGIAYIELADEASYEMALSHHHSMLDNRRINVLYTRMRNSKIDKKEAKSKMAKLVAMQKSGQLLGSAPLASKRSARRKKQKLAKAREQATV